jgi:hypothetical protein
MFGRRKQVWVLAVRPVGDPSAAWLVAGSSNSQPEVARWARQYRRRPTLSKTMMVEAITAEEFVRWNEKEKS